MMARIKKLVAIVLITLMLFACSFGTEKEARAAFVVDDVIAIAAVSLLIAGGAVFASSEAGQAAGRKIASTSSDIYNAIANRVNGVITLTAAAAIALKTFITYDLSQAISEPVEQISWTYDTTTMPVNTTFAVPWTTMKAIEKDPGSSYKTYTVPSHDPVTFTFPASQIGAIATLYFQCNTNSGAGPWLNEVVYTMERTADGLILTTNDPIGTFIPTIIQEYQEGIDFIVTNGMVSIALASNVVQSSQADDLIWPSIAGYNFSHVNSQHDASNAFAIDLGTYWYRWAVKSAVPEVATLYSDSAILGENTTIDTTQAAKNLTGAAVTSLTPTDSIIGKTSTDIPIDYTGVDDPPVDPPIDPPIEEPTSILDALAKLLATIVAIPHLIAEAISTTFTAEKPGDTIDFTKLKFAANLFTNKFPFSLPWDLQAMVTTFGSGSTIAPVIPIGIGNIETNIDLSRFNSLAAAVRVLELFAFGVGLLLGTRKLLGGAS